MDFDDPRFKDAIKQLPRVVGVGFYLLKGLIEGAFSLSMGGLGPLLMLVGHTIIVGLVYIYFTVPIVPATVPNYIYVPWTLLGLWLVFNIFFNWHMCAFISPGYPPKSAPNSPYRICSKCDRMKPPRTHHCSACGVCVLAMDHHCPWMNNCVGFYNYKYFFLFLLHTWSGIIFNLATCAYFYPVYSYMMPSSMTSSDLSRRTLRAGIPRAVLVSVMLSISVGIAVSFLFVWHCYLAGTGQSTIEFYQYRFNQIGKAKRFNDYDLGRRKNFEMIFGKYKYPLGWTLPSLKPPIGNGMNWPTVKTAFKDLV